MHEPEPVSFPHSLDRDGILAGLTSTDSDVVRSAAMACRDDPEGIDLLGARLHLVEDTHIAEILILSIVAIGGPRAAQTLVPLLRSNDPGRRFAAIEALRDLGADAQDAFDALVQDADPDVRTLAAEIARGPNSPAAAATLAARLAHEEDLNVCCAFVDVLAEIGSASEAAALRSLLHRFPDSSFLRFSVDAALARLAS